MAIDCEKLSLIDGEFGPNGIGHKYKPMSYHGVKAKKSKDKTRCESVNQQNQGDTRIRGTGTFIHPSNTLSTQYIPSKIVTYV